MPGTPRWIWIYGENGAYMVEAPDWDAAYEIVLITRAKWASENDNPSDEEIAQAHRWFTQNDQIINYEGMICE